MRFALVGTTWHAANQMSWIESLQPQPQRPSLASLCGGIGVLICICVGVLNDVEGVGSKSLPFRRRRHRVAVA